MPLPGPDFLNRAKDLAGERPIVSSYLSALYGLALYQTWFTLDVKVKGVTKMVRFIPGHTWDADVPDGPTKQVDVMVIGKMPTREEMRAGRYMDGPTGEVLGDSLQRAGCSPNEYTSWYLTDVVKFGHPAPHTGTALAKDWIKDCRPLLYMEMCYTRPKYILCLGSEAVKELLGITGSVTATAGSVFDYTLTLPDGTPHIIKVMTCISPSACTRSPDMMPQLDSSIRLFVRLVHGGTVDAIERDVQHITARTEDEALQWLNFMCNETAAGGAIAIDCEWQGEYPNEPGAWLRTIQVSHKGKFGLCLVMRECGGADALITSTKVRELLCTLFKDKGPNGKRKIRAVGHFHRADLPWLLHYGLDITKQFEAPADPINGWELTKTEGGFDTGAAAHSVCETDDYKLEVLATRLTTCPRYDVALQKAKKDLCAKLKIGPDSLPGYGDIPDSALIPYSIYDVDATRRLFDIYNGIGDEPGLLDCDDYRNNSRMAFWISMRASAACHEIEQTGLVVDMKRAEALTDIYRLTMARKLAELKAAIKWEEFNHNSPFDCRELLFGPKYRGQYNKETHEPIRKSPPTAVLCGLMPVKATGKATRMSWQEIENTGSTKLFSASTDRESLGILFHQTDNKQVSDIVSAVRDIKFIGQLLKSTLKPPAQADGVDMLDEDGERVYEKGLLSYVCNDGRIRTHIFQTLETGRYASARVNLQNISKRREADYARILGDQYLYPLRSIFVAAPGHVLMEADYVGAELAGMAWMSGDPTMIDHVRRAQLKESDPDYYDIHSAVAVSAFKLACAPTKGGLASINMTHLRVAAKNVVFGYAYGRGAEAICRQAKEEGVSITVADAQALIDGLAAQYPLLPVFFAACRNRTKFPGYTVNCFGRARRFRPAVDNKTQAEQERQAQNFGIQSLVADAVSRALDHLYYCRDEMGLHYKIALQIHDAVLLEVPCEEAEIVYDKVLPRCMTEMVDIRPCDLDGVPTGNDVHHLGIDCEVYLKWGEKITDVDEATRHNVPLRFVHKPKKKK